MINKFISPPKERTSMPKYRDHTNEPVNLSTVTKVCASRERYYPDDEGIPVVKFTFVGGGNHLWYFDKGEEGEVKKTIASILSQQSGGSQ
jgi:hypothetical protein